jgi:hypothetical protein
MDRVIALIGQSIGSVEELFEVSFGFWVWPPLGGCCGNSRFEHISLGTVIIGRVPNRQRDAAISA